MREEVDKCCANCRHEMLSSVAEPCLGCCYTVGFLGWVSKETKQDSNTTTTVDPKSTYYDAGGIESINILRAKLTPDQFTGFCIGNAIKYLTRCNFKHDDMARDLEKAGTYIGMAREGL